VAGVQLRQAPYGQAPAMQRVLTTSSDDLTTTTTPTTKELKDSAAQYFNEERPAERTLKEFVERVPAPRLVVDESLMPNKMIRKRR